MHGVLWQPQCGTVHMPGSQLKAELQLGHVRHELHHKPLFAVLAKVSCTGSLSVSSHRAPCSNPRLCMPCSCTVVTQSGVSGISYTLDLDQYVVDLFVDNQCPDQGPSFASFDQNVQCFTNNPVASAQKFPSSDAVSWECDPMPRRTVSPAATALPSC